MKKDYLKILAALDYLKLEIEAPKLKKSTRIFIQKFAYILKNLGFEFSDYYDYNFYMNGIYDKLYYDSSLINNKIIVPLFNNISFKFFDLEFENPSIVPACCMSRALPLTASTISIITTSATCFIKITNAAVAPTFPAPIIETFGIKKQQKKDYLNFIKHQSCNGNSHPRDFLVSSFL